MDNSRRTTTATTVNENTPAAPGRGRGCGCWIALLVVLLAGGGMSAYLGGMFALRQDKPTPVEATLADLGLRTLAVEDQYKDWRMPDQFKTAGEIAKGQALFGAECSLCHGQTGKGDGDFGKTQFPPAANLTSDTTRTKTDGMLFWEIWHGVNYTGMPAWGENRRGGKGNSQQEIWEMVAYIRSLEGELPAK